MSNKVDNFLQHYASQYYDPVKAHEYYMRNRELKGRRSTSDLNDEGKEIWSYTKNEIKSEKKAVSNQQKEAHKQTVTELRNNAAAARKRITERLKQLNAILKERSANQRKAISDKNKSDKKQIEDKKSAEIERLQEQEIPKNVSAETRARMIADRKEKISRLRENAKSDKQKIGDSTWRRLR